MNKILQDAIFYLLIGLVVLTSTAHASFRKNLWPIWEINNAMSTAVISHEDWQTFLTKRVITNEENINLVDYAHITNEDYNLLKNYIENMAKIAINNYNRDEQLAFWINLYNALTVRIIADYYPVSSIEEINISPGLFSTGPWKKKIITVNNIPLSLDEIENRIIRPIWHDERILYALNNGSIGAANLAQKAYQGATLNQDLNNAAIEYVNSLRGAQVIEGALIVSKIYDWYMDEFGGTKQAVLLHLKKYAKEPLSSQLKHVNNIDSFIYNWHLNCTVNKGG